MVGSSSSVNLIKRPTLSGARSPNMHHASRHVQCSSIPSGKAGRLAVSVQIELRRIDGGRKITYGAEAVRAHSRVMERLIRR